MMYFEMAANCGCCTVKMAFESEERLLAAFKKQGLTVYGKVTDDEGVEHEEIDTFYGFTDVTVETKRAERKARKEKGKKKRR
jgi:hypothetical protein